MTLRCFHETDIPGKADNMTIANPPVQIKFPDARKLWRRNGHAVAAIHEYDCGCSITRSPGGEITFHACPLHNAAGELLAACKQAVYAIADDPNGSDRLMTEQEMIAVQVLRAAIAATEGRKA
jgi:hypothetical protein